MVGSDRSGRAAPCRLTCAPFCGESAREPSSTEDAAVGSTKRLETGLAMLRAIAQSDAVRDVRGRLREGAMTIAESERVPRVLSAAAGVLAALLDEPAEVYGRDDAAPAGVDSWATDVERHDAALDEPIDERGESEPIDEPYDDAELEESASLRDLDDPEELEEQLLGVAAEEHAAEEDDVDDRLLKFEAPGAMPDELAADDEPEQPPAARPSPARPTTAARKGSSAKNASRKAKAASPKSATKKAHSTKPSKAPRPGAERATAKAPIRKAPRKK